MPRTAISIRAAAWPTWNRRFLCVNIVTQRNRWSTRLHRPKVRPGPGGRPRCGPMCGPLGCHQDSPSFADPGVLPIRLGGT
jgi:hypothetical protein